MDLNKSGLLIWPKAQTFVCLRGEIIGFSVGVLNTKQHSEKNECRTKLITSHVYLDSFKGF